MQNIRLVIVSNQIMLCEALSRFLNELPNIQVMGETSSCQEALELGEQLSPDIILADVELPPSAIEEMSRHLRKALPELKLILFSSFAGRERLIGLMPLQANGYLTTDLPPEVFIWLVKSALANRLAISPSILDKFLELPTEVSNKMSVSRSVLTPREVEVLQELATGATNREIARSLVISECTVKNHIHNMLDKLKIQNRTQLISYVLTKGMLFITFACCQNHFRYFLKCLTIIT